MTEQRDSLKLAVISEEAAEWFIRLKDEHPAQAVQDEYVRWLSTSPAHIAEALRVEQLYGLLRRTRLEQPAADDDLWKAASSDVVELEPHGRGEQPPEDNAEPLREERRRAGWRHGVAVLGETPRWRRWVTAAAWPVVFLAGLLAASMHFGWFGGTIETGASEWRHFTLADGSIVRAGPRTRMHAEFKNMRRVVELSGGEAFFQVAKDPARPFVVRAGTALVRAVGTEFGVSSVNGRVLVTVAEGKVAVSQVAFRPDWLGKEDLPGVLPERTSVAVSAGEQAAVPAKGPVTVQRVNVANELAWTEGRLIFETETVGEAVDEFNRRNRLQIEIENSALASRPVRGVFDAADPESFAQFLARAAHVEIVRDKPGVLVLQRPVSDHGLERETGQPPGLPQGDPPAEVTTKQQ